MAILAARPEDEEQVLRERMGALAPDAAGGAAMGGGSGSRRFGNAGPALPTQRGGSPFVSFDKYVAANQGATQALGDKVVGQVNQAGTDARNALGQGVQAFNQAADAGEVRSDAGLLKRLEDPFTLTTSMPDLQAFTRMRDASYTGPRALEERPEYEGISKALADARETSELAKSEGGLGELSDKVVTGQRTAGGRALDTNLLLTDQNLRGRLDSARQGLEGLAGEVETASKGAQERAAAAQKTTDATREQTRGALTSAQQAFEKQLDDKVERSRLEAFYRAVNAQNALRNYNPGLTNLPTAGAAGRYYDANDPTQGGFRDAAIKGNVPEFIHGGSGQAALPGFEQYVGQNLSRAPTLQELADLGISPQQWAELAPLFPVVPLAQAAAMGTNNVNPYAFLEAYGQGIGDLSRFAHIDNPNATITRENLSSPDDYARAAALAQLAGPELAQFILDPAQAERAGTANLDLVNFDVAAANAARNAALGSLAQRAGVHVAGNARSGGDTFWKKFNTAMFDPLNALGGIGYAAIQANKADDANELVNGRTLNPNRAF